MPVAESFEGMGGLRSGVGRRALRGGFKNWLFLFRKSQIFWLFSFSQKF